MTSSAFMLFLRFLVLFGLFLSNSAFAVNYNAGGSNYSTALAACQAWYNVSKPSSGSGFESQFVGASETTCTYIMTAPPSTNVYTYTNSVSKTCDTVRSLNIADPAVVGSNGGVNISGLPSTHCDNQCSMTYNQSRTDSVNSAMGLPAGSVYCLPANSPPGSTVQCYGTFVNNGAICGPVPTPSCFAPYIKMGTQCVAPVKCTLPQLADAVTNTCITPACPSGTSRLTATAECTPIQCVAPMVRVGNVCQVPSCPVGQTYEFKNGAGACTILGNPCASPKTLINGTCQNPVCAAGTALNSSGQCVATTGAPSTGTTGSGISPTLTTTSGTAVTTNTSTGSTTTSTSTTTTSGGGGTGGSGTCTSPPCGACDPAVTTCGTSFGGSCKDDFQCSGDAIQCAVAKATNKSECALLSIKINTEDNPVYTEGQAAIDSGAGGAKRPGSSGGIASPEQAITQIEKSNPFNSSCPADYSLATYKGTEIKIPLSKMCNIFEIMGKIMLACAGLICVRILTKED